MRTLSSFYLWRLKTICRLMPQRTLSKWLEKYGHMTSSEIRCLLLSLLLLPTLLSCTQHTVSLEKDYICTALSTEQVSSSHTDQRPQKSILRRTTLELFCAVEMGEYVLCSSGTGHTKALSLEGLKQRLPLLSAIFSLTVGTLRLLGIF